ncbi:DUF1753-domain-containing protein [Auriculariales sp. MPI-PUGE-AT-0066]|nr:DUF1753-domain-containing protein [Auriculariales sp. MPI-PUGE-AT-0066]
MRLTLLRARWWRPRPFRSFMLVTDLKTGSTVTALFALVNKVAGVYGLIALLTGAGGSLAQLSLYVYSTVTLIAFAWGLRALQNEDSKRALYFAHMYFADHLFASVWTVFFGVQWWVFNPHDGKRQANSAAQQELADLADNVISNTMTPEERAAAALSIWNKEKGFALAILIIGWVIKILFALYIYSYAFHLRQGTYRTLPATIAHTPKRPGMGHLHGVSDELLSEDEHDASVFSVRTPNSGVFPPHIYTNGKAPPVAQDDSDEVLFDEDERNGHSRLATEESASQTSGDQDDAVSAPLHSRR